MTDTTTYDKSAADQAAEEYYLGCNFITLHEYRVAIKYFYKSIEVRGETTPDLTRNLGWCYYRIAEYEAFQKNYDEARNSFETSTSNYRQSEAGYKALQEAAITPLVQSKIGERLSDCQNRLISIESLNQFLSRQEKFEKKLTDQ